MLVLTAQFAASYSLPSMSVAVHPPTAPRFAPSPSPLPTAGRQRRTFDQPPEELYKGVAGSEEAVSRFWSKARYLRHDAKKLEEALVFASAAHSGQHRKSGEPYIVHPVETATILAELRMDTDTLIAGLLHDTIEDTDVQYETIERRFGTSAATIVQGVTDGPSAGDDANKRELLLAMSTDWRIVLVKLADRLHNMRTLGSMPRDKQVRKAEETMAVFVPLAKELGVLQMEEELEVRCAQTLFPQLFSPLSRLSEIAFDARPLVRAVPFLRRAARIKCPAQLDELLRQDQTLASFNAAKRITGHRQRWAQHVTKHSSLSDSF